MNRSDRWMNSGNGGTSGNEWVLILIAALVVALLIVAIAKVSSSKV